MTFSGRSCVDTLQANRWTVTNVQWPVPNIRWPVPDVQWPVTDIGWPGTGVGSAGRFGVALPPTLTVSKYYLHITPPHRPTGPAAHCQPSPAHRHTLMSAPFRFAPSRLVWHSVAPCKFAFGMWMLWKSWPVWYDQRAWGPPQHAPSIALPARHTRQTSRPMHYPPDCRTPARETPAAFSRLTLLAAHSPLSGRSRDASTFSNSRSLMEATCCPATCRRASSFSPSSPGCITRDRQRCRRWRSAMGGHAAASHSTTIHSAMSTPSL